MPLIQAFKDPHIGVRQEAAWALADIGADAVPYLAEALADPDPRVRKWITRAMLAMTNPMMGRAWSPEQVDKIAPALRPLLDDEDPEVRDYVKWTLESLHRDTIKPSRRIEP
jgi:HEAT repeat protein